MEGRGPAPAFRLISSEEDSEFAAARASRLVLLLPAGSKLDISLLCDHRLAQRRAAHPAAPSRRRRPLPPPLPLCSAVPPDITVPVPPVNGSHGGVATATSSHVGDGSEAADGEGAALREGAGAASDLWAAFSFGRSGAESRGGFRSALNQLLRRGNDLEAAAVNHRVGRYSRSLFAAAACLHGWAGLAAAVAAAR